MAHRTVREVMTAEVATVTDAAPFKEVVAILAGRGVSALPVLDSGGRVAGIVSEIDLLRKEEYQEDPTARRPPRWRHRAARARADGVTAGDLMTSPAVTIRPDASVVEAARALDRQHVRRLVVIDGDGNLVGIVAPPDLLKVYLRSDEEIGDEIVHEVITEYLGTDPERVAVTVAGGRVTLAGEVEKKSMIRLAVKMAHSVDGVVSVAEALSYAIDDTHVPPILDQAQA
jgi:CBS domain-containing protein